MQKNNGVLLHKKITKSIILIIIRSGERVAEVLFGEAAYIHTVSVAVTNSGAVAFFISLVAVADAAVAVDAVAVDAVAVDAVAVDAVADAVAVIYDAVAVAVAVVAVAVVAVAVVAVGYTG